MRLRGLLQINGEITQEITCNLSNPSPVVFLEIPFQNLPMLPVGSSIYLKDEKTGFYMEDIRIVSYTANQVLGTLIGCEWHEKSIHLERNLGFFDRTNNDRSVNLKYREIIDFSKC